MNAGQVIFHLAKLSTMFQIHVNQVLREECPVAHPSDALLMTMKIPSKRDLQRGKRTGKPKPGRWRGQDAASVEGRLARLDRVAELYFGTGTGRLAAGGGVMSLRQIAKELGCSHETVRQDLELLKDHSDGAIQARKSFYRERWIMESLSVLQAVRPTLLRGEFGTLPDGRSGGSGQAGALFLKALDLLMKLTGTAMPDDVEVPRDPDAALTAALDRSHIVMRQLNATLRHADSRGRPDSV